MEKQFVTTGETPRVTLEQMDGEFKLKGWDERMVAVKNTAAEHIQLEQRGEEVVIRCQANCSVRVPRQAVVIAKSLSGNAIFKGLEGELTVENAQGDLDLRSVGPTNIQTVHGNLTAKDIAGDLEIGDVGGNAAIRDVDGELRAIGRIRGNLQLDDVDGGAQVQVDGNAIIRFDPMPGEDYHFEAGGNLVLRVPSDASAELEAQCGGTLTIKVRDVQQVSEHTDQPYRAKLGDGEATLKLKAGGNLSVSTQAPDWEMGDFGASFGQDFENLGEAIAEQVASQIEAQVEMIGEQIEIQMERLAAGLSGMGLSEEQRQRVEERARQAGERAAERARERARQAQERLERKLEAARRRAEAQARSTEHRAAHVHVGGHRSWNFNIPTPPVPPVPPHDPVSDEERITILRMLEQKKITLDEAEKLLAALEGK